MRTTVSLGLWQDRAPEEALTTAMIADDLGYPELWIGEMATWDAFALATAVGTSTERMALTVGPLAVAVRDPVTIAMGAASVRALVGRPVGVALGTSSPAVVSQWHGRSRHDPATALAESAFAVRGLLAGEVVRLDGKALHTNGYRLRLAAPNGTLSIAAFGPRAIEVAATQADRVVLNLVSPAAAGRLAAQVRAAAERAGRDVPPVAVWVPAAVDPYPGALLQLRRGLVPYLAAPGYREMFRAEGFGALVDLALGGAHPRELLKATPPDAVASIGLLGTETAVRQRIAEYAEAGVEEIVVVASATDEDPAGEHTLRALAPDQPRTDTRPDS